MTGLKAFFTRFEEKIGTGFYLGKNWILNGRKRVRDCLIAARITRAAVHKAIEEQVQLIVSIYPPIFIHSTTQKIAPWEQEVLTLLIENKIGIFSLGQQWLIAEGGGFDHLLELLDFPYKQPLDTKLHQVLGHLGERERSENLEDLLAVIIQLTKEDCRYFGYNKQPIKRLLIVEQLARQDILGRIITKKQLDAIIAGEVIYETALALQQQKNCAVILLGRHALENLLLGKVQRILLEALGLEQGNLPLFKQKMLWARFPPKKS